MESIIQEFMAQHEVPGLSIAIAKDDRLVCADGFGLADREANEPVTIHSCFRIASITKPITAVAVLRLVEQGDLRESDLVFGRNGILGTAYGTQPYEQYIEDITVEHLLAHTSGGWQNDADDPMFQHPEMDHSQLISWTLDNRPLDHPPGVHYAYSNFGYCLLGRVIEKMTGKRYDLAVRRLVLRPCGIEGMGIAQNKRTDRQFGEVVYYGHEEDDPYAHNVMRMDAHGGWIASASDLVRFAVRVNGFPHAPDILQSDTIRRMTTPSSANPGYALGWAVNEAGSWWHGGACPALPRSSSARLPACAGPPSPTPAAPASAPSWTN